MGKCFPTIYVRIPIVIRLAVFIGYSKISYFERNNLERHKNSNFLNEIEQALLSLQYILGRPRVTPMQKKNLDYARNLTVCHYSIN